MFYSVEPLVLHLFGQVERLSDADYWRAVWEAIESLPTYATGDNYCIEIRPLSEVLADSKELYALPIRVEGNWDSYAFAQQALAVMGGNESLAEFSAVLRAARIEVVRSRMFCVATHIYWTTVEPRDAELNEWVHEWLEGIGTVRLTYADDEYYKPLLEPQGIIPAGSAAWLRDWLQFRYEFAGQPVEVKTQPVDGDEGSEPRQIWLERSHLLAGAAFAWNDYSLVSDASSLTARQCASAAGLALAFAIEAVPDENGPDETRVEWGRAGGLKRHESTRALKEWALAEASRMKGQDRAIARELAGRLPARLATASEDPVRFIYDAIRANRAEARGSRRPRE